MLSSYFHTWISRMSARFRLPPLSGIALAISLTLLAFALAAPPVHAAGVVGTGTPASCTQAAIETALAGGGNVTFNCGPVPATIAVTSQMVISSATTIDGGNLITLDGGGTTGILKVNSGTTLTVENLVIANGKAFINGGGIENDGTLNVGNSTFAGNIALGEGGGIENEGTANVSDSTFAGNSSQDGGGAIENFAGTLNVYNSSFSANESAPGSANGGGINNESGGTLAVTNSTFSANNAENGGAISDDCCSTLYLTNSTISGNQAHFPGTGGGIFNDGGPRVTAKNSIIAGNSRGNCGSLPIADGGHNLDSDGSCGVGPVTDPMLDPAGLRNNGGTTETIALLPSSPALGAGDVATCQGNVVANLDQTNRPRTGGSDTTCDIGAFEGYIQPGATFTANTSDPILNGACRSIYCPLRDAVNAANTYNANNANAGATINLSADETYALDAVDNTTTQGANGLPVIASKITINGNGASIGRDGTTSTQFRIFQVNAIGTLTLNDATVANGAAGVSGGGLLNNRGTVNINMSTFSFNMANTGTPTSPQRAPSGITPSGGGAIYNIGTLSILASTFNLNSGTFGGAVDNGGKLNLTNSTLTDNTAANLGGALFNGAGTTTAINDTFADDGARRGGEIAVGGGSATLKNTIVANDASGGNCFGAVIPGGHNLRWPASDPTCVGAFGDPHLGPLQDNGGPTQTLALLPFSAAFGGGDKVVCLSAPVDNLDQRGVTRISGIDKTCDIGAYEGK